MKILKKILAAIAVLTALLCILILLCALNPNITKKLASLVSGKASSKQTQQEEAAKPGEMEDFLPGEEAQEPDSGKEQEGLPEQEEDQPAEEPATEDWGVNLTPSDNG